MEPRRSDDMILVRKYMCLAAVMLAISLAACSDNKHEQAAPLQDETPPPVIAEVVKVDKKRGMVTLKHGPIPHLGMSGMTMAFRVKEPAMLDSVKEGDKVDFLIDKYATVTAIEPTNKR
jgi:Cu(I)/Ag(I) efflux system periplasmic protein CusF